MRQDHKVSGMPNHEIGKNINIEMRILENLPAGFMTFTRFFMLCVILTSSNIIQNKFLILFAFTAQNLFDIFMKCLGKKTFRLQTNAWIVFFLFIINNLDYFLKVLYTSLSNNNTLSMMNFFTLYFIFIL